MYNYHTRQLLGRRDVASMIHFGTIPANFISSSVGTGLPDSGSVLGSTDGFQQCPQGPSSSSKGYESSLTSAAAAAAGHGYFTPGQHPNFVAIVTALICIVGLMLPTGSEHESSSGQASTNTSFLPSSLHLSVNQKLLVAYTLGLVTMVIFRP